jgi:hypothetical protein
VPPPSWVLLLDPFCLSPLLTFSCVGISSFANFCSRPFVQRTPTVLIRLRPFPLIFCASVFVRIMRFTTSVAALLAVTSSALAAGNSIVAYWVSIFRRCTRGLSRN